MLCRNKPTNPQMFHRIIDKNMVQFLIKHGCHPLYMDNNAYYFSRNDLTQMWIVEYKSSKKGGSKCNQSDVILK